MRIPAGAGTPIAPRLRDILAARDLVLVPGCYDALTARIATREGFQAVHISGACAAALELGVPDLGITGVADILSLANRVIGSTRLPVVADADAGFGDAVQVAHMVRRYERAGIAGLHLEDQVMPKRCGHMSGKLISPLPEAAARIRAAVRARDDIVIIARTDALSIHGFADVLERVRAFADEGVDAIFVEGLTTTAQIEAVGQACQGLPQVVSLSEAGGTPALRTADLAGTGVRLVLFPVAGLLAAVSAYRSVLRALRDRGRPDEVTMCDWDELNEVLDLPGLNEFERSNN